MTAALCTVAVARARCVRLALPELPRAWDPQLSVLDADFDGKRWIWHVPAKPANDVTPGTTILELQRELERFLLESAGAASPILLRVKGGSGRIPAGSRRARKATLAAWPREQEGSVQL